ncbi:hypothetical protein ACIRG4_33690 [Streptomyces sp. NPDC102395]|uniref:hypothetical protein n=1 Tax=Streptomyces sp. NPDC102395 TaxID=3366168 RepID=UPI00382CF4EB
MRRIANEIIPYLPAALGGFAELVIPRLRRRGLFRTRCTGGPPQDSPGLSRLPRRV